MTRRITLTVAAAATIALAASSFAPASAGHGDHSRHGHHDAELRTVVDGLDGPRGVDALGHGLTLVTETDGTFSLVIEGRRGWHGQHKHGRYRHTREPQVIELGQLPTSFAPAIAAGKHGTVWLLTGGGAPPEDDPQVASLAADEPTPAAGATLFKWRPGWDAPVAFADIAAYQATDPDPYDLEGVPEDSNPFGLAALDDGGVLVADAAGNDLLRVSRSGEISTVARLKPREVVTPEGLPGAGTTVPAEAVATSVTVGDDGYWYIGELRGYPATPGTSEIWKVRAGTTDATCDPESPWGACKRYADGLTSIVDLGAGPKGIYAVTLSKMSWLAVESPTPVPGAEIGGLFLVSSGHRGHHHYRGGHGSHGSATITELVPDQLVLPGGVDVAGDPYIVGPVFGPGSLMKIS
ncbi:MULTISPECIES: ScyD/ScyE family protein [unclassified Nocardioides]|uniref:ScyD/ScyE family protein n=1 Tax=unclassified Nocardioides TaxID=2615069 RepID=UPI00138F7222|nr:MULTISPECIES: ScyD/ScyE family protein [unclassified Nocardioides]